MGRSRSQLPKLECRSGDRLQNLAKVQARGQWRALIVVRYDKSSRLAAEYRSLPRPLQDKLETLAQRPEEMLTSSSPPTHKRMTGKYMLDVFGGSGFRTKARNYSGLRGFVLDTKFGLRYDVTQPPCSHQNSTRRLRWKVCRRNDFTSTTPHLVFFQSLFSQCCHR